jgi:hypothetical protein
MELQRNIWRVSRKMDLKSQIHFKETLIAKDNSLSEKPYILAPIPQKQ